MARHHLITLTSITLFGSLACIKLPTGDDASGGDGNVAGEGGDGAAGFSGSAGNGGSSGGASGGIGGLGGQGGSGIRGTAEPGDPCSETQECIPGSICFNEFCVGEGQLRISLAFDVNSDFDLHVTTPNDNHIYYGERSADGGNLDVDQCVGSCSEGAHVENVVFESAPAGTYTVWVVNYNGRSAGDFTIEVAGTVNETFSGSLPAESSAESERFTFTTSGSSPGGNGGAGNSGGSGGSDFGGSGGFADISPGGGGELDCENSCPSEFPAEAQLDAFCRMACCYVITGAPENASAVCSAGENLGTASCNYCLP